MNDKLTTAIAKVEPKFVETINAFDFRMKFSAEARFALQAIRNNDDLQKCTPASIADSMLTVAALGLSLNPALAHAYLIPWKTRAGIMVGYRGLLHMALEDGGITSLDADVVYSNDEFEWQRGSHFHCVHRRVLDSKKRGQPIGAYCIWHTPDDKPHGEFMDLGELDKVRAASKMKSGAVWTTWRDEMYKKAVIKRASKLWKKTDRFGHRMAVVNELEGLDLERQKRERVVHEVASASQVKRINDALEGNTKLLKKIIEAYSIERLEDLQKDAVGDVLARIRKYNAERDARRSKRAENRTSA